MAVNFDKPEERKKYIESKFSDLLENINHVYGKGLMDRLIIRLEKTIELFDKDVQKILDTLDKKDKEYMDVLPKIDRLKSVYIKQKEAEEIQESRQKELKSEDEVIDRFVKDENLDEDDHDIIKRLKKKKRK